MVPSVCHPPFAKCAKDGAPSLLVMPVRSNALAGEWVQVMQLEQRLQVYYCTTLIREIDLGIQRSTIVEHWIPS